MIINIHFKNTHILPLVLLLHFVLVPQLLNIITFSNLTALIFQFIKNQTQKGRTVINDEYTPAFLHAYTAHTYPEVDIHTFFRGDGLVQEGMHIASEIHRRVCVCVEVRIFLSHVVKICCKYLFDI